MQKNLHIMLYFQKEYDLSLKRPTELTKEVDERKEFAKRFIEYLVGVDVILKDADHSHNTARIGEGRNVFFISITGDEKEE